MKKIIFALSILAIAASASAADVPIGWVVPDAYVQRAAKAVMAEFPDCVIDELNAKQCVEKHGKQWLIKIVRKYERQQKRAAADATVTDIELD